MSAFDGNDAKLFDRDCYGGYESESAFAADHPSGYRRWTEGWNRAEGGSLVNRAWSPSPSYPFPEGPRQATYKVGQRVSARYRHPWPGVVIQVRLTNFCDIPEYLVKLDDWTGPDAAGVVRTTRHEPHWMNELNLSPASAHVGQSHSGE